ncbi:MAG: 2-oxoacid:acceptor oxidoreductase subunit alpha [Phycisphaerae bacterium]
MSTITSDPVTGGSPKPLRRVTSATIRFAGDSGDGMQIAGTQFTSTSAVFGNDVSTLPDFPAEIRAPAGTLAGVSGFQINFSSQDIHTPGDQIDALIAMNPAALKTNLRDLVEGGILIVNTDEFAATNLAKARYVENPLENGELAAYRVFGVPITQHTLNAVAPTGLGSKEAERCKNFYALGLVYWLYDRPLDTTLKWIATKFSKNPQVADANVRALKAGFNFGETAEMFAVRYEVERAKLPPGRYRNITGNTAMAIGLATAARLAKKPLVYASYPITPASDILHTLSGLKHFDVRTMQAEDEIAAITMAIGAAFAGAIGVTASAGPGIALKQEAVGLAVMTELPCVIIDVQRGGPSTGLPTKPEQTDLFQVMLGRNGECPAPVVAAASPGDCFYTALEAVRIALKYMTPVFVLSDGFTANSAEPWQIPDAAGFAPIEVRHASDAASYAPYRRDEHGSRPWAIPGTPGLEHRLGGLEKSDGQGEVSYDPDNHERMVRLRAQKVANIARDIPEATAFGPPSGDLLVVSWGGAYGVVRTAVERAQANHPGVAHLHLRWLNPLPNGVGELLRRYRNVLVCELNLGQLQMILRGRFAIDAHGLHKVQGKPFRVKEVVAAIEPFFGGRR